MPGDADSIFLSTNAFPDRRPEAILHALDDLPGNTAIEFSALDASESAAIAFARQLHADGRQVAVHNYFPAPDEPFVLNLGAADDALRRQSIDFCRRAIDLSAELGALRYAAHPGYAIDFSPADLGHPARQAQLAESGAIAPFNAFAGRAVESLLELAEHGRTASSGVTVLAENNVVALRSGPHGARMVPMASPAELAHLTDAGIPLLFDVAHAKVSATTFGENPDDWFQRLRHHVVALHLSDNDGTEDTGDGFDENAWFAALVKANPDLPVTVELNRKPVPEIARHLDLVTRWKS